MGSASAEVPTSRSEYAPVSVRRLLMRHACCHLPQTSEPGPAGSALSSPIVHGHSGPCTFEFCVTHFDLFAWEMFEKNFLQQVNIAVATYMYIEY
jgi:hypothetical protein